jgi:hypothetical protein
MMREITDGSRREQNEADCEQENWAKVRAKVPPWREKRRWVEQGREEEKKNELGIEFDFWKMRE